MIVANQLPEQRPKQPGEAEDLLAELGEIGFNPLESSRHGVRVLGRMIDYRLGFGNSIGKGEESNYIKRLGKILDLQGFLPAIIELPIFTLFKFK